ncbi:MAG: bifunctional folylpolyglutamate synthase/dihydrofolate synthase [Gemmatimonadaceae bacterium]
MERTRELLAALGDPHLRLRAFHVGGTNGKGSVSATLETLLRARGLRVGKYTSPHLVDFRERIVVDGRPVSEAEVVAWVERWTPECERIGATFFEATTAMAFDLLAHAGVEAAVIEVGLGGRLDSTNVVMPVVAGVVSIGLDHTEYLGDTLEQIADEKAGIFKPGVPAVIGEPDEALRARLAARAREAGAREVRVVADVVRVGDVRIDADGTEFTAEWVDGSLRLRTGLAGRFQATNALTALVMLDAAGAPFRPTLPEVRETLPGVRLPGRFHRAGDFVFDVAHNPAGAAVLAETLRLVRPPAPVAALLGVLGDKDWRGIVDALGPVVSAFVMTDPPTAPTSRAWRAAEAAAHAASRGWRAETVPDFDAAIARARALGRTVLVTGSFHTVGDAMSRLQVSPLSG